MKTKLLLLLLLANFSIYAQYTSIPDVNFENKLISLGIDSGVADGRVLTSKVSSLTYLYVETSSITDLTGIEAFTALKDLRCSSNRLTKLNVSKNIALTSLECSNNLLTTLDISNNPLLQKLDCSLNKLTALDFSNNTALKNIYCNSNQLTTLNVSKQLMLEYLFCDTNKIETLDLSPNVNLSTLTCYTNLLQNLDLSKNTKIHYVRAHDNRFISFNIQNGTNYLFDAPLSTLTFSSPNLKCVQVDNVEEANVRWPRSEIDAQYSTYCSPYTIIPDANFEKKLIALGIDKDGVNGKVLTADITSVTSLNVSNSSITDLTGIEDFHSLTNLSCDGNQLSTLDITKNVSLTTLSCNQNKITTLNVSRNTALKTLSCSSNQLTKIDLFYSSSLQILDISKNKIEKLAVTFNGALTSLYLDENLITSLDVSNNPALTSLSLNGNQLTILNLAKNTLLTNASFKSNPDLYCIQVSSLAYANTNWSDKKDPITSFSASPCVFTDYFTLIPDINFENKLISLGIDSGVADGKILTSKVTSLTSLNVSQSSIKDLTGLEAFVALKTLNCANNRLLHLNVFKNTLLTSLECNNNQLNKLDLSNNPMLLVLECSNNNILALDFSNNTALKSIKCYNNFLNNINLSKQLALESLDINFNRLQALDVSSNVNLQSLICNGNSIASLDLSKNNKLTTMLAHTNDLTRLNIKNGANILFSNPGSAIRFDNNQYLVCIQVDDIDYSNKNWSSQKNPGASFNTDCTPYTLIPDINFEQKLIDIGLDSGAIDGKVLTSKISTLKTLNLTKSNISDLTGIQDFVSLTNLYCGQNSLKALNLSNNNALTVLDCINTQITALDLSNNLALTTLYCGQNSLTALNVSKNTALTVLNCNNNQIATLDVSNNVALTDLTCYSNKLTSLNIKVNTALTKLDSGSNQYTSLDLSSNTALTFLGCNTSQLTSIDVSKNTALTLLDCRENKITNLDVSKLTALTELYCQSNQLKDLDVSKNKSLELINCSKNQLTTLDISVHPAAIGLYANSNQLTSLNLKNGNNANFQLLYLNLTNNPNLSCIQVDDKAYSDANWSTKKDATASYEANCTSYYTEISDSNFEQKLINLGIDTDGLNGKITTANISSITSLDLSNSNIKDLTGIENFTALNILDCSNNQLTTLDLSKNSNLQILYVTGNPLVYLNLKNGNNQNLIVESQNGKKAANIPGTSFLGLINLGCVKVDSAPYSNANWSRIKEATTTYSETCTLGLEDSILDKIVMYPNPTKGEVNILNVSLEKATVYNSLGQLVKTFNLDSSNTINTINLSGLPKGIYYIYLINQDAASAKKVIVE
ncbi:putative secreted protein (Por secretion system target) [Flavobacterium sp. 270]|uniref:leucine-rich repeat domain-containing protein n=1 Tax=Flavobacterium sp. 270 TaxID=2512114 RepID=UPI0010650A32|nr:leucine-rich repeat domain-containing protein [Flavobacterium sp. 270]TDW50035.1 putative secreted protein (Por secretion system target) [Flavobacterium sp. 270]